MHNLNIQYFAVITFYPFEVCTYLNAKCFQPE